MKQIQSVTWPGVNAVASCTYVTQHGITPGKAILTCYPQKDAPQEYGDLVFSDGQRTFKVPRCKVDSMNPESGPSGTTYTLEILDERWTWAFGGIAGHYNRKDNRQKLVPWTIRSPEELALLCLNEMKVKNFIIDLPKGLTRKDGVNLDRYLRQGENFPQSFTNPETFWSYIPPATALAALADFYSCHIIYQPNAGRVVITTPGKGKPFPELPYESIGGTIDGPEAPAFVGVIGAPVKFQSRFMLEAVGKEWDGSYLPIEDLSYAPVGRAVKAVFEIRKTGDATDKPMEIFFKVTKKADATDNHCRVRVEGFGTYIDKFARLVAYMNNGQNADFVTQYTKWELVEVGADAFIRITCKTDDTVDVCTYSGPGVPRSSTPSDWHAVFPVVKPENKQERWTDCKPPYFPTVQATDRLSYEQAKQLAEASVFRCYRIRNRDPHDKGQLNLPGRPMKIAQWGVIKRRQQIVLLESKADQVKPAPRIAGGANKGGIGANPFAGFGILPDFYNGYSRDQPNTVAGSVWKGLGSVNWLFNVGAGVGAVVPAIAPFVGGDKETWNTELDQRVYVEFAVDPVEQIITFSEPVFRYGGDAAGGISQVPDLVLEAGHYVLDPENETPIRWLETLRVPGGTAPTQWREYEDVAVSIVGIYGPRDKLVGTDYLDVADARARAGYYLRGMAAQYKITGGETRRYIGIVPHDPDGFCLQVSVSAGEGGPTTILSGNTEHHPAVPPAPARRRAELLPPDKAAAVANLAERAAVLGPMPDKMK